MNAPARPALALLVALTACTGGSPPVSRPSAPPATPTAVPTTAAPTTAPTGVAGRTAATPASGREAVERLFAALRAGDLATARTLARGRVDPAALRELARRPDVRASIRPGEAGVGVRLTADPELRHWPPCEFYVTTRGALITGVTSCPAPPAP